MQLDKILQSQGFGSRKHCQQLISNGQVQVSGQVINDVKQNFDISGLSFVVFGAEYLYREKVYIALHKPLGYECSHRPQQHHSVFDLLPEFLLARNVQSIGRLDQDTTGLLLLSDDGQYLHSLTHPRKHVAKYYRVTTADDLTAGQISQLQQGVQLKNESQIFMAHDFEQSSERQCRFAVHQGVYHQVKRMLAAVGNHVTALHRDQIGQLCLDKLPIEQGEWCYLNESEYQHAARLFK